MIERTDLRRPEMRISTKLRILTVFAAVLGTSTLTYGVADYSDNFHERNKAEAAIQKDPSLTQDEKISRTGNLPSSGNSVNQSMVAIGSASMAAALFFTASAAVRRTLENEPQAVTYIPREKTVIGSLRFIQKLEPKELPLTLNDKAATEIADILKNHPLP